MREAAVRRGIYLLEEVEFHPMNSRKPLEYLTWLTRYKREDDQMPADAPELTKGLSVRSREVESKRVRLREHPMGDSNGSVVVTLQAE